MDGIDVMNLIATENGKVVATENWKVAVIIYLLWM